MRSSASSFNFQCLLFSLMHSSSFLHILPHISVPSILSLIIFREFMVLDKMGSIVLLALIAHHTPDNDCGGCFSNTKPMTVLFHKTDSSFTICDAEFCFCVCTMRYVQSDHQMTPALFDRKWRKPIYRVRWHVCTK